jgi:hypothetical protein
MPKRAEPGDGERLEAALSPSLRAALVELRELFMLHDWQRSGIAPVFQEAACLLEAERLVRAGGISEKDAIDAAAVRLGLSGDTTRTRFRDWYRESRRGDG